MTIEASHAELHSAKFGKETPAFKIHYYGNNTFAVEENGGDVVAGAIDHENPYHQEFYTFLTLEESIELAKIRAAEYHRKYRA